jgi:hypothetical protein
MLPAYSYSAAGLAVFYLNTIAKKPKLPCVAKAPAINFIKAQFLALATLFSV